MNLKEHSLYIDMDGVVSNLDGHYERRFGVHPSIDGPKRFWKNVDADRNFFFDIDPYPGAASFVDLISFMFGRTFFLTACSEKDYATCAQLKKLWLSVHMNIGFDKLDDPIFLPVLGGKNKGLFCQQKRDVLVDDHAEKNGAGWKANGGIFIHHPPGTEYAKTIVEIQNLNKMYE